MISETGGADDYVVKLARRTENLKLMDGNLFPMPKNIFNSREKQKNK